MKKAVNLFLLAFYSFGTFCLPMGDFSMLNDIPEMYRHCKATEDKEMTPLDFLTDHLVNIDGIFDKHDNGDQQKPHQPIQNHHFAQTTFSFIAYYSFSVTPFFKVDVKLAIPSPEYLPSDYTAVIFRPPILV